MRLLVQYRVDIACLSKACHPDSGHRRRPTPYTTSITGPLDNTIRHFGQVLGDQLKNIATVNRSENMLPHEEAHTYLAFQ